MMYRLLISLCLFLSAQLHADEWSVNTEVKEIIAGYSEGLILFSTVQVHNNPKTCKADYYTVDNDEANLEVILSMLLAAQRSGSEIQVGVDSSKCALKSHANGRINVTRIKSL